MDLSFLKSNRFWALIVLAVVAVLDSEGIISHNIAAAIELVAAGFVGIRTVDRFSEKMAL